MNTKNTEFQKDRKQNRSILKGVRMTEAEAVYLKEQADREYMSEGAWIRMKLFDTENEYVPFEIRSIFDRYIYDISKSADKIDSVTKECKMHMSIDAYDLRRLENSVEEVRAILTEIDRNFKDVMTSAK